MSTITQVQNYQGTNSFVIKMKETIKKYGTLTPKQAAAVEKILSAADVVVLTSDNEGTPLSLIQAGMAGLPVVSTNVGSVPEIVLDGITGIITATGIHEIADALEKLFNDPELRARMGASAGRYTLANYGVKRLVHDHESLYLKLLK